MNAPLCWQQMHGSVPCIADLKGASCSPFSYSTSSGESISRRIGLTGSDFFVVPWDILKKNCLNYEGDKSIIIFFGIYLPNGHGTKGKELHLPFRLYPVDDQSIQQLPLYPFRIRHSKPYNSLGAISIGEI